MTLSKNTADQIVAAVAADTACQKAIVPNPTLETLADWTSPGASLVLEFGGLAGGVRNFAMIMRGLGPGDPVFDERICLGIAAVTIKAIHKAMRAQQISGVASCSGIHRVHWGVEHEATWIRTTDDGEYVFDWHSTLRLKDPRISKASDWMVAGSAVNYVFFKGFD